jgi:hypothetical protein
MSLHGVKIQKNIIFLIAVKPQISHTVYLLSSLKSFELSQKFVCAQ